MARAGLILLMLTTTTVWAQVQAHEAVLPRLDRKLFEEYTRKLTLAQNKSGGFYSRVCFKKSMNFGCRTEKTSFYTGLITESLLENELLKNEAVTRYAINHLEDTLIQDKGEVLFFNKGAKLRRFVKADLDSQAIIYGALFKTGKHLNDQDKIRFKDFYVRTIDDQQTFFATWLDPSAPFFNDTDIVVNTNALTAYGTLFGSLNGDPEMKLNSVCTSINRIVESASHEDLVELKSERTWIKRKKINFSQWYPSRYTLAFSVVRAYLDLRKPECLRTAYEKIRTHLLKNKNYGKNVYAQAMGTLALKRILKAEKQDPAGLKSRLEHLFDYLETENHGQDPYFFYGVGYSACPALAVAAALESLEYFINHEPVRNRKPGSVSEPDSRLLEFLNETQQDDGSFTALIIPSSPMYNAYIILLYEYLNLIETRQALVKKLINTVFDYQHKGGGIITYSGGHEDPSLSVLAYVAAKIAGENEDSERMLRLESAIHRLKAKRKIDFKARPFLMLFNLNPMVHLEIKGMLSYIFRFEKNLPWVKYMLYPFLYLIETRQLHTLSDERYPHRIYERSQITPQPRAISGKEKLFAWLLSNMNPDGTFFDYTPTSIPALMMLSTDGKYEKQIKRGLQTLESFQKEVPSGILQTPGDAAIGETFFIVNALLDLEVPVHHPIIAKAVGFLTQAQIKNNGGWGFSKNSAHFADTDDTSNVMYLLQRLHRLKGNAGMAPGVEKALGWLLKQQNKDGGFATWEKGVGKGIGQLWSGLINSAGKMLGMIVDESVVEHTARIIANLYHLKGFSSRADIAYHRALHWLLDQQQDDGSFKGTWFVDYVFGTSMALTALSTAVSDPKVKKAADSAFNFIVAHQRLDGGFGESPQSFVHRSVVDLGYSSVAQTGLIGSQLVTANRLSNGGFPLTPVLERAKTFLVSRQKDPEFFTDPTWIAVTFPRVEYLIYPYIQMVSPLYCLELLK